MPKSSNGNGNGNGKTKSKKKAAQSLSTFLSPNPKPVERWFAEYIVEAKRTEFRRPAPEFRPFKDPRWTYLIKWSGYEEKDNTWEPISSLQACRRLLTSFWDNVGQDAYFRREPGTRAIPTAEWIEAEKLFFAGTTSEKHVALQNENPTIMWPEAAFQLPDLDDPYIRNDPLPAVLAIVDYRGCDPEQFVRMLLNSCDGDVPGADEKEEEAKRLAVLAEGMLLKSDADKMAAVEAMCPDSKLLDQPMKEADEFESGSSGKLILPNVAPNPSNDHVLPPNHKPTDEIPASAPTSVWGRPSLLLPPDDSCRIEDIVIPVAKKAEQHGDEDSEDPVSGLESVEEANRRVAEELFPASPKVVPVIAPARAPVESWGRPNLLLPSDDRAMDNHVPSPEEVTRRVIQELFPESVPDTTLDMECIPTATPSVEELFPALIQFEDVLFQQELSAELTAFVFENDTNEAVEELFNKTQSQKHSTGEDDDAMDVDETGTIPQEDSQAEPDPEPEPGHLPTPAASPAPDPDPSLSLASVGSGLFTPAPSPSPSPQPTSIPLPPARRLPPNKRTATTSPAQPEPSRPKAARHGVRIKLMELDAVDAGAGTSRAIETKRRLTQTPYAARGHESAALKAVPDISRLQAPRKRKRSSLVAGSHDESPYGCEQPQLGDGESVSRAKSSGDPDPGPEPTPQSLLHSIFSSERADGPAARRLDHSCDADMRIADLEDDSQVLVDDEHWTEESTEPKPKPKAIPLSQAASSSSTISARTTSSARTDTTTSESSVDRNGQGWRQNVGMEKSASAEAEREKRKNSELFAASGRSCGIGNGNLKTVDMERKIGRTEADPQPPPRWPSLADFMR
ncbi:hypothetical protein C8F01DRAFT_1119468 [Mycena amicta]|nr:hypothetical protein C8F01DRAFT_1119468 [Mycena amicta]